MKPSIEIVRDRTPRLSADGKFYCSPSCGGGHFCRKEWYDSAVIGADELCSVLGDGWEPVVWENLGWFYKAEKGSVTVYANVDRSGQERRTTYSAWICPGDGVQIIANGDTPEDALGFAVQDARTRMARMSAVLSDLAGIIGATT